MFIHGKIERSRVNGPGERAVVWLAGCTLGCLGCWNPETHRHGTGEQLSYGRLSDWILSINGIEGVTFSGGEPIQQIHSLLLLINWLEYKKPELSFGLYTGYTLPELETGRYEFYSNSLGGTIRGSQETWEALRQRIDFAVMGRYNQQKRSIGGASLLGSSNQELHLFSNRYRHEDFNSQRVEVTISPDAKLVKITGFPKSPDAFKELSQ